jgi:hypothetical protein
MLSDAGSTPAASTISKLSPYKGLVDSQAFYFGSRQVQRADTACGAVI